MPGFVFETIIFVSISYFLMGLRPDYVSFIQSCILLIITCNTAAACGNLTSYITDNRAIILILLIFATSEGTFFSATFESIPLAISFLIPFDYILFITGGVLISLK